jgi:OOP family OmpA-OmpF porin
MRLSVFSLTLAFFVVAGVFSLLVANASVQLVEDTSEIAVRDTLDENNLTWAEVEADGLRVILAGEAPTEALRFRALSLTGSVVDSARIIDELTTTAAAPVAPPRFSVEILRNTAGVSIIGLIPASTDRESVIERFGEMSMVPVSDLLETADYPAPAGWEDALAFAVNAARDLPRAKLSVDAGRVEITGIAESAEDKAEMERKLRRAAPPALRLSLNITAPRPVITPFTLRFVIDEAGARFDACSADTEAARMQILKAATEAGLNGSNRCTVGMGVPGKNWTEAVEVAIKALAELGGGSVTFSNADLTLVAAEGTAPDLFDRIVGELENDLPDVFVLTAVLPETPEPSLGPAEFFATLSPEGQVQLRGRLPDEKMREVAHSFAQAKFGSGNVYTAARVVDGLPADWPLRVLTGIEALGVLNSGVVRITADTIALTGKSGNPDASDLTARLLADKLGGEQSFEIDVTYVEELDPAAALPTAEECEAQIGQIVQRSKINFEPGSATIDASALSVMDEIALVLKDCGDLRLEIQGHTDSQGREEMNLALSQARAESVLNELRARRVLTGSFVAKGYGEATPIAENGTEEGREANRRIEFRLIRLESVASESETALETSVESSDTEATEATLPEDAEETGTADSDEEGSGDE